MHTRTPRSPPTEPSDTNWTSRYGDQLASLYHLPDDLPAELRDLAAKISARTDADRKEQWEKALAAGIDGGLLVRRYGFR